MERGRNTVCANICVVVASIALLAACGLVFTPPSPTPEPVGFVPVFTKPGTDWEFYLGMPVERVEEIFPWPPVDKEWTGSYDDQTIGVYCLGDRVAYVGIGHAELASKEDKITSHWRINGFEIIGINIEDAKSIFGNAVYEDRKMPVVSFLTYRFSVNNTAIADEDEPHAYEVQILYREEDAAVLGITFISADLDIRQLQGGIHYSARGSGSTGIPVTRSVRGGGFSAADITHSGQGDFVLTLDGEEIFRRSGEYSGRVLLPGLPKDAELLAEADGDWTIIVRSWPPSSLSEDGKFSGTGDDATAFSVAQGDGKDGRPSKWKLAHDGEGTFIVRQVALTGLIDEIWPQFHTIVEIEGAFDGVVDSSFVNGTNAQYFFEIVADGNWTIEPAE